MGEYRVDTADFERLVILLSETKNKNETRLLLRSLLTNREMADIVRRVTIAKLIGRGMTYDQIAEVAGVARPTIALVNNALKTNQGIFERVLHRVPFILNPVERAIIKHLKKRLHLGK